MVNLARACLSILPPILLLLGSVVCPCVAVAESRLRAFIGIDAPKSFHPMDCADGIMSDHLNTIFDTLFWIDYSGNLVPALGVEWKRIDPLTVQIRLRKNVFFHNGEIFDSKAVKYTFDIFTDSRIKVANRFYGETISRVEIVDGYTINIVTKVPDSLLVYRLATIGMILPPKYHSKVGMDYFSKHPIGTGPFKFVRVAPGGMVELQANDSYWAGRPSIDRLEFHL